METYAALAAGGICGAVLRYWLVLDLLRRTGPDFPYGILTANLIGSFLIAFLSAWQTDWLAEHPGWRLFFIVGLLGSFTTFSTFSLDLLSFFRTDRVTMGVVYALASVIGGVLLAWLGWTAGLALRR